jgi:hypothetical protein
MITYLAVSGVMSITSAALSSLTAALNQTIVADINEDRLRFQFIIIIKTFLAPLSGEFRATLSEQKRRGRYIGARENKHQIRTRGIL